MTKATAGVTRQQKMITIALNRGSDDNTITGALVDEIDRALSEAEADPAVRVVVLRSDGGVFSAGLDFQSLAGAVPPREPDVRAMVGQTFSLLKRFTRTSKVVVAHVDGAAKAGGVGLAAACDVVIASERATFGLSEALFGLLPAAIAPFLMRRVGFQKTYLMTLTTQTIDAREALRIGLVDELTTDADESLRRLLVRVDRVREQTVGTAKQYFAQLWPLADQIESDAVRLSASLICDPENLERIRAFVERQELPWQKSN